MWLCRLAYSFETAIQCNKCKVWIATKASSEVVLHHSSHFPLLFPFTHFPRNFPSNTSRFPSPPSSSTCHPAHNPLPSTSSSLPYLTSPSSLYLSISSSSTTNLSNSSTSYTFPTFCSLGTYSSHIICSLSHSPPGASLCPLANNQLRTKSFPS